VNKAGVTITIIIALISGILLVVMMRPTPQFEVIDDTEIIFNHD
jgi:hypothetical protein